MVKVYQFQTLDEVIGRMVTQPVKSTAERIGRIPGARIIEGTAEDVPAKAVDADGRMQHRARRATR